MLRFRVWDRKLQFGSHLGSGRGDNYEFWSLHRTIERAKLRKSDCHCNFDSGHHQIRFGDSKYDCGVNSHLSVRELFTPIDHDCPDFSVQLHRDRYGDLQRGGDLVC